VHFLKKRSFRTGAIMKSVEVKFAALHGVNATSVAMEKNREGGVKQEYSGKLRQKCARRPRIQNNPASGKVHTFQRRRKKKD